MMRIVEIYECSDGFRSEDLNVAAEHERNLSINEITSEVAKVMREETHKAFSTVDWSKVSWNDKGLIDRNA